MGLYMRNKTWWFNLMYDGRRYQQSLGTGNKKLAEKIFAKLMTDIVEGRYFDTLCSKKYAFDDMVSKYMAKYEKPRDIYSLKNLFPYFSGLKISDITPELISEYKFHREGEAKPATIYQELAVMRKMFNIACREWKWVTFNPVSAISFSVGNRNRRDRWLTLEEEQRLLANATTPHWLKAIIIFALQTGMRRGEILNLTWMDIDFKGRNIFVRPGKNGEARTVPMSGEAFNALKNIKAMDISGRLFPVSLSSLRDAFAKAKGRSGIDNLHFHDLRHTFATRLVQNGVDIYTVSKLLGHKSITMTTRYAHHYTESLRRGIAVLDKCYNFTTNEAESTGR
ncbi:MAG: site-specific integrase [Clostridiaceae bacterium]|nr:site-specific integrase [Clostridiaceae bacterium]